MPIFNAILSWLMKKRYHQIDLFRLYPIDVQTEVFRKLVAAGKDTEWGDKYGYSKIETPAQYREAVPVSTYDDLEPLIRRVMAGEQNVLWPTHINWFAKSSGTTASRSKFIPVSQESLEECHMKGGKDMLSIYCTQYPDTQMFDGRGLGLGGSHHVSEINNAAFYGDVSAIIMKHLPNWANFIRTPDLSIALMDEWESKLEKMARVTRADNVTSLVGVPSWTLILLHKVLELSGRSMIGDVWPNLEVFFHGGVSFNPYREQFSRILPEGMRYLETYNASEGFFGIQDDFSKPELLLMLDYGIYYEFIPLDHLHDDNPVAIGLDQVETNVNYAMVISTNAGLWRYLIGDTVEFTSLYPFHVRITGRTKSFINAFGEEVINDNAEKALMRACRKCGCSIREFTAAPVFLSHGKRGRHEWLIEFECEPPDIGYFADVLDTALKSENSDYEAKRYQDLMLEKPLVRVLPPGTFYNWMKVQKKLGGQQKVPRLSNDRKIVEEISELIGN